MKILSLVFCLMLSLMGSIAGAMNAHFQNGNKAFLVNDEIKTGTRLGQEQNQACHVSESQIQEREARFLEFINLGLNCPSFQNLMKSFIALSSCPNIQVHLKAHISSLVGTGYEKVLNRPLLAIQWYRKSKSLLNMGKDSGSLEELPSKDFASESCDEEIFEMEMD